MNKNLGAAMAAIIVIGLPLWWFFSIETSLNRIATALEKIVKEKEE